MDKKLIEIASEIVQAQVARGHMTTTEISSSLLQVFEALHELQLAESGAIDLREIPEPESTPALKPEESIRDDRVICLECGAEFRQLTKKHLVSHGLSSDEYRRKYGFSKSTPLAAKSLIKARQATAQKTGLSERMKQFWEAKRLAKATVGAGGHKTGGPRSGREERIKSLFSPKQTN